MKVFITGAGGQVGRALVRSAPAHVRVIARAHSELDIGDEYAVARCIRLHEPDVIINAAAYTNVDRAQDDHDVARSINADGARHLAVSAQDIWARLIHISTDFVFDGSSSIPYKPEAERNPLSVYGATKRAGEDAVLNVVPNHSVVLRTAWVYAPEGRNFVRTMLRAMRESESVRVVADQIGAPTSAQSLAEVIWKIVEMPHMRGIHHWTDAGVASWYDFAVAIAEEAAAMGLLAQEAAVVAIATHEYPTPARRPPFSVLDTTSLRSLGIVPVHWRKRLRGVLREIKNA